MLGPLLQRPGPSSTIIYFFDFFSWYFMAEQDHSQKHPQHGRKLIFWKIHIKIKIAVIPPDSCCGSSPGCLWQFSPWLTVMFYIHELSGSHHLIHFSPIVISLYFSFLLSLKVKFFHCALVLILLTFHTLTFKFFFFIFLIMKRAKKMSYFEITHNMVIGCGEKQEFLLKVGWQHWH